jgi:putative spermidine/putrescine transport system ATP-binding protein
MTPARIERELTARRAGAAVSIRAIAKRYGTAAPALDGVSLEIAAGEFVTLLGASGSGKTTTLMIVAGFTPPDAGDVSIDGKSIIGLPPERRGIGVVFQNYALFPHMTALRNIAFPLRMRAVPRGEAARRAEAALARSGSGASAGACRRSSRAASSNGSRWRGRLFSSRGSC